MIHDDTRGILHPTRMLRDVTLMRYPVTGALEGLIDWGWSVQWNLRAGETMTQDVAPQPSVNLSIGTAARSSDAPSIEARAPRWVLNGVTTGVDRRRLVGRGWNVAAKSSTGGFGAWIDDVAAITDRAFDGLDAFRHLGQLDALRPDLPDSAGSAPTPDDLARTAAAIIHDLEVTLAQRDPARIREAREIAAVARGAETDRSVRRVDDLARSAGVSVRTLQRRFASCAGVSPTWVIRRFRLLEAAELVREGDQVDWSNVAATLGYADQAHLVRDFRRVIGASPAAYARAQRDALLAEDRGAHEQT